MKETTSPDLPQHLGRPRITKPAGRDSISHLQALSRSRREAGSVIDPHRRELCPMTASTSCQPFPLLCQGQAGSLRRSQTRLTTCIVLPISEDRREVNNYGLWPWLLSLLRGRDCYRRLRRDSAVTAPRTPAKTGLTYPKRTCNERGCDSVLDRPDGSRIRLWV